MKTLYSNVKDRKKIFFRSLQNLTGKDNTYLQIDNASFGGLLLTVLSKKLNNNLKKKHFSFYPYPFFHSIPFLPHLLHPTISLHSVFLPVPFSPSLSFRYIHSTVLNSLSLSLFIAHSTSSFLSFYPVPVFSLLVPTSRSHYNFSFFLHSLFSDTPEFPLSSISHTPCCIWIL
jgi:hypothetical protein